MKNYIREKCERCDVSIGTAERTVRDDLNLKKKKKSRDKMDTPSPKRPGTETESGMFNRLAQNV